MEEDIIITVIEIFRNAPRMGADRDEPEGVRCIQISDTLANKMADELEKNLLSLG